MLKTVIKELSVKRDKVLLSGINFELKKNCIHTVLGLNGSGKTTLIKSLTGLLNPQFYSVAGNVFFEGKDILTLDKNELLLLRRDKIKYVFQDAVNSFNHLKTFGYYFDRLAKNKEEINILLTYFILPQYSELYKLFPYEVSGGMAQRISFILALLAHPEIIILDEPTSGIDPAISNLFLLKLKEFVSQGSHSILLVTHNINFAEKISDEIAFLSDTKLSVFYPKKELFSPLEVSTGDNANGKPEKMDNSELLRKFINAYKQLSL
ncbi:MAG: ATP-binding cassette domain-containing protein [Ignavibacteriaceae bacterium]|jgi:peptide/nickel transport system ATP-binding protein